MLKKILKNLFAILLISIISISLTGCDDKNDDDIINNANKQSEKNNTKKENEDVNDVVALYSDDTKMVFNVDDVYYMVYYHDGTKITGMEYVYSYPDVETAKFTETTLKSTYEKNDGVESVERSGKQIKILFDDDSYEDLSVEEVKKTYSMYEQIYKKD